MSLYSKITNEKAEEFHAKQRLPYQAKLEYAENRAMEFLRECGRRGLNTYVSVGGLDSITLFQFLRSIGIDSPGVSVSFIEDKTVREVHKELGIIGLTPLKKKGGGVWTKQAVLQEVGFPILSKIAAHRIHQLMNPTERNLRSRKTFMTGWVEKKDGTMYFSERSKLANKWLKIFAGNSNDVFGTDYTSPDFPVSDRCCYYLKEAPLKKYSLENNSVPYMGLMGVEGGRREDALIGNGCNYFSEKTITSTRSCPFAIFTKNDLLQLALDLNVHVPEIYGEIAKDEDGNLYTTKADRTGCQMCGFGIQKQPRPHRFDLLYFENPKEWEFWMNEVCVDENGERYGWGRVLDYIGVPWRDPESTV